MDLKEYSLPLNSMMGGWFIPKKICDHLMHLFQTNADKHQKGVVGPHPAHVNEDIKTSTESLSIILSIDPTIPPVVMTLSPLFRFSTISLCSLTFFCCGRIKKK